jgi:hypothetical protein
MNDHVSGDMMLYRTGQVFSTAKLKRKRSFGEARFESAQAFDNITSDLELRNRGSRLGCR